MKEICTLSFVHSFIFGRWSWDNLIQVNVPKALQIQKLLKRLSKTF